MKKAIRLLLKYIPRPLLIRGSLVSSKVIAVFLRGDNVECPVCQSHFKKFLPYGYTEATGRDNVLCPKCFSLERHRMLWLYLHDRTDFFTAKLKVLHIAPEQCFYKRFRALENLDYTTGDLVSPIADVHFDIQEMPFDDESYDVIICNHVLEHVDDDIKAMKEIYRVLKKGGFAILHVPQDVKLEKTYEDPSITDPLEREKHFHQKDHLRLYGLDYPDRLASVGFKVRTDYYAKELPDELVERYRLPKDEIIYFNQKV